MRGLEDRRALQAAQPDTPLRSVALISRWPVVFPEPQDWEVEFRKLQVDIALEREAQLPALIKPARTGEPEPLWVFNGEPYFPPAAAGKSATASASEPATKLSKRAEKKAAASKAAAAPAAAASAAAPSDISVDAPSLTPQPPKGAPAGITFKEDIAASTSREWMFAVAKDTTEESYVATMRRGPRETEADRANDETSLERKLAERLFLVVKRNGVWDLPAVPRNGKERLVAAAERAAKAVLPGASAERPAVKLVSPLPAGYRRGPLAGSLDFVYHALLVDPGAKPEPGEYAWLTGDELAQRLAGDEDDARMYLRVLTGVV